MMQKIKTADGQTFTKARATSPRALFKSNLARQHAPPSPETSPAAAAAAAAAP